MQGTELEVGKQPLPILPGKAISKADTIYPVIQFPILCLNIVKGSNIAEGADVIQSELRPNYKSNFELVLSHCLNITAK